MKEKFQFIIENQNLESSNSDPVQKLDLWSGFTTTSSGFEPEPFNMEKLQDMIKLNELLDIKPKISNLFSDFFKFNNELDNENLLSYSYRYGMQIAKPQSIIFPSSIV